MWGRLEKPKFVPQLCISNTDNPHGHGLFRRPAQLRDDFSVF
jgi:hypothetical protein